MCIRDRYRRRHEALRRFFGILVEDVISSSKNIILDLSPNSIEDIRNASGPVIRFSDKNFLALKEIKSFLFNNMSLYEFILGNYMSVFSFLHISFNMSICEIK